MERELGVSYPTVRNRLDTVIEALGYTVDRPDSEDQKAARRRAILEQLGKGSCPWKMLWRRSNKFNLKLKRKMNNI